MKFLIAMVFAALSACASAATQNAADVAYLQNGVRGFSAGNFNGSLIVFGEQAFPVVTSYTAPLIAAARLGKGRMVVMRDTATLEQDLLHVADTARLTANILRWAAGEKTTPNVGVYKVEGLESRLKTLGFRSPTRGPRYHVGQRPQPGSRPHHPRTQAGRDRRCAAA